MAVLVIVNHLEEMNVSVIVLQLVKVKEHDFLENQIDLVTVIVIFMQIVVVLLIVVKQVIN